jgi:hypothetical protein
VDDLMEGFLPFGNPKTYGKTPLLREQAIALRGRFAARGLRIFVPLRCRSAVAAWVMGKMKRGPSRT